MRVLIMEPNEADRTVARDVVEAFDGACVVEPDPGGDATEADLAIIEIDGGEADGLDAVRALREANPDTPTIVLSADARRERVIEAIQAGAANFVVKPFTPDLLSQRIEETVRADGRAA